MSRRFADLNEQEVLALAIHVERANRQRFETLAAFFEGHDEAVQRLLLDLRDDEVEHERTLLDRYSRLYGDAVLEIDENDVAEVVEAVDVDDAEAQVFGSMGRAEMLRCVLAAEQNARRLYERAVAQAKDEGLRRLFHDLLVEEMSHAGAVEERLAALSEEERP